MKDANTMKEIMANYNKSREEWIKKLGANFDENEFHKWFTKQVIGN